MLVSSTSSATSQDSSAICPLRLPLITTTTEARSWCEICTLRTQDLLKNPYRKTCLACVWGFSLKPFAWLHAK